MRYASILIVTVRWVAAALLIYAGGTMNFVVLFSDYPDAWSEGFWVVYLFAWHALIPCLIGLLIPVAWFLAAGTLAGTYFGLVGYSDAPAPFVAFAATTLASAWLGSRVRKKRKRRSDDPKVV